MIWKLTDLEWEVKVKHVFQETTVVIDFLASKEVVRTIGVPLIHQLGRDGRN